VGWRILSHPCNLSASTRTAVRDGESRETPLRHLHTPFLPLIHAISLTRGGGGLSMLLCQRIASHPVYTALHKLAAHYSLSFMKAYWLHSTRKLTFQTSSRYITKALLCHRRQAHVSLLKWLHKVTTSPRTAVALSILTFTVTIIQFFAREMVLQRAISRVTT
jgi:hypothetical protein